MKFSNIKYPLSTLPIRILDSVGIKPLSNSSVDFVIENGNWSIKWDGISITNELNKTKPNFSKITTKPYLSSNKIVHFGSQFQCVSWYKHMAKSNKLVCTFFHGKKTDDDFMARHVDDFLCAVPRLDKIITAATIIENRLLEWGVPRKKIIKIPIGIDTVLFTPFSKEQKAAARLKYGIKPNHLVIGSFQKDGEGWGDGMTPKMIKGPDILVNIAKNLSKHTPIMVFLTGPARGYVKEKLDSLSIPYIHEYLDNYLDLPSRFAPLDVYINPSREEGGPKGILEAMASGVFVVSTKVGMAPDVIQNQINGVLIDYDRMDNVVESILLAKSKPEDVDRMTSQARKDILLIDWSNIAQLHYNLVYKDLL